LRSLHWKILPMYIPSLAWETQGSLDGFFWKTLLDPVRIKNHLVAYHICLA
jgi:hypothetical protein